MNVNLSQALQNFPTLERRGLSAARLQAFGVTNSPHGQLYVPILSPAGAPLGTLIRTVSGIPKYIIQPDHALGYLYNYHRLRPGQDAVIVLESPFDVHTLWPLPCVALIGVNISPTALYCLEQLQAKTYIVALDMDGPGQAGALRLASKLTARGLTTIIYRQYLQIRNSFADMVTLGKTLRRGSIFVSD